MRAVEFLTQILTTWISRISNRLAHGEGLCESFQEQIYYFFYLVLQAVETGDPAWLNPALNEWAQAHLQTDLENGETNLPPSLEQILLLTYAVAYENLSEGASLDLLSAVLPVYTHA